MRCPHAPPLLVRSPLDPWGNAQHDRSEVAREKSTVPALAPKPPWEPAEHAKKAARRPRVRPVSALETVPLCVPYPHMMCALGRMQYDALCKLFMNGVIYPIYAIYAIYAVYLVYAVRRMDVQARF